MTWKEREGAVFIPTYNRLPLEIIRGEGMFLVAADGRRYLDMTAGLAVNALGNAHPRVIAAIADQASRYVHLSNYFLQEPQIILGEMLTRQTGYPRVFFTNSGTEATEGAIKFARRRGAPLGKSGLVSLSNAFHGRTLGALSVMDRPSYRNGFGPFLDACTVAEFNNPSALERAVSDQTAAVILEFIQGEGGVRPISRDTVHKLQTLRELHGFLLIADEIQSGLGRTGRYFGFQHYGVRPDIVTMAKPLGGGLPLGAILATEEAVATLGYGSHGTTFGGNPVACAAGIAVLSEIAERNLIERAAEMGTYLIDELRRIQSAFPSLVTDVRGFGLMVGMELSREGDPIVGFLREQGTLINCTDRSVLRFLPPLIAGPEHIDATCAGLREALGSCR
jgi:acetylornithine/N-succinyldiaminopimelate aminotransferase